MCLGGATTIAFEAALKTDHWNINGSPQLLPAGWKDGAFGSFKMN